MAKEELSQFLKNRKFVLKDNRKKWLGRNFITLKTDDGIEPQIEFSIDGETRSLIGGYDTFCWTLKVGGTELQRISFKSDLFKTDLYAFVETQSEKYPGLKDLLNKTERLFHTTKELELEEMESWMPAQQPESSDDEAILPSSTEESQPWQYYDPKIAIKNEVEEFIKLYQIQDRTEAQNKQYWDFIQKLYSLIKSIERTKLMGLPYNSTTEVMLKIATEELQLYLAELKKYGIELIEEAREKKASTRKKSKQTAPPSTSSFSLANFLLSSLFMTTGVSGGLNFSANSTGLAVYNHPYSSAPFNPTGTSLHQYNNPLGFGSQPIPSLQYYLTDGKGLNCLVAPQNCLSSSIVESRSLALFSPITNTLPPPP